MGQVFFSYGRADNDFVLKLAKDLRAAGVNLWIDQLDIAAGDRWDRAVEEALEAASCLLVVLSPDSVESQNVMDEVSLGFDEQKRIVPVLYRKCDVPFRLRRLQHIDFTVSYDSGLEELLKALKVQRHADAQKSQNNTEKLAAFSTSNVDDAKKLGHAASLAGEQYDTKAARSVASNFRVWPSSGTLRKYLLLSLILALAGVGYIFLPKILERTNDPSAAALSKGTTITVYTQISSSADQSKFSGLKTTLANSRFRLPDAEVMNKPILHNEIRFCNPENESDADALKAILEKSFPDFQISQINKCDTDKNKNVLEVWLQSGAM